MSVPVGKLHLKFAERTVANVLKVESQHSSSNLIQIKTGGSRPMTVAPVTVARKESQDVTPRTIRARSKGVGRGNGRK